MLDIVYIREHPGELTKAHVARNMNVADEVERRANVTTSLEVSIANIIKTHGLYAVMEALAKLNATRRPAGA